MLLESHSLYLRLILNSGPLFFVIDDGYTLSGLTLSQTAGNVLWFSPRAQRLSLESLMHFPVEERIRLFLSSNGLPQSPPRGGRRGPPILLTLPSGNRCSWSPSMSPAQGGYLLTAVPLS